MLLIGFSVAIVAVLFLGAAVAVFAAMFGGGIRRCGG
jgi:hypothetical protein